VERGKGTGKKRQPELLLLLLLQRLVQQQLLLQWLVQQLLVVVAGLLQRLGKGRSKRLIHHKDLSITRLGAHGLRRQVLDPQVHLR